MTVTIDSANLSCLAELLDEGQVKRIITLVKRSAQNPDNSWRAYDEELVGLLEYDYTGDVSAFEYNADRP